MASAERLAAKETEWSVAVRMAEDFDIHPCQAKAHLEQVVGYLAESGQLPGQTGQVCFSAIAAEEPSGKPLTACRKVQVHLQLVADEDLEALHSHGLSAMRHRRISRLARQAQEQGGLLSVEDLALLTCSSIATLKRDAAVLRKQGDAVPTRGQIREIGGGISHRVEAVRLYLAGVPLAEIERRTGYAPASITGYVAECRRVADLHAKGLRTLDIRKRTGLPAGLIERYVALGGGPGDSLPPPRP